MSEKPSSINVSASIKTGLPPEAPAKAGNASSKSLRYLKYALGEIILVVLGILIALQINNWNQERVNKIERTDMLTKLNAEFIANKKVLEKFKIDEDKAINAQMVLINLVGSSREELANHDLDSLFYESFPSNEISFVSNAIAHIVQSGGLNILKDDEIAMLLHQWNALNEIMNIRVEKLASWTNSQFLPFLLPHISFKEMDTHANFRWAGKSRIKPDYYPLFQRIELENLLDNCLWLHQQLLIRLDEAEVLIDKIIKSSSQT